MIKSSHRNTNKSVKRSSFSRITNSTKRFGKQTLRDILLSKTFHKSFKVLIGFMIAGTALYGAYAFIDNSISGDVVISQSEILFRVSKHTHLPTSEPSAGGRERDAETRKKESAFDEKIKEGDYIIIYPELAVIYDLRDDSIVGLKKTGR